MDALVDGRAAQVHADRARRRRQLDLRARQRVVEAHRADRSQDVRSSASSRGSAASTAASSGPRSAPVSASRSARRSPPTAFSSRTIARASSDVSHSGAGRRSSREALEREPCVVARAPRAPAATTRRAYSRASRSDARRGAQGPPRRAPPRPRRAPRPASPRSRRRRAARAARDRAERRARAGRARRGRHARPRPESPSSRSSAIEEWPCRFDSFFPSGPRTRPWWITSGSSPPSARAMPLLHGQVRPVIGATNHVRDPEREVVDDGGELVRRGPVRAQQRRPLAGDTHGAVVVALSAAARERLLGGRRRRSRRARSGAPAPRRMPTPSHASSPRIASSPPATVREASVSSMRRTRTPPCSSANRRLATAVSALPTWSEPVGLGAKRTRTDTC